MPYVQDNRINAQMDRLLNAVETADGKAAVQIRRNLDRNIRARTRRITGKLRAGTRAIFTRQGWTVMVGVRSPYWRYLEYGTRRGIEPRRFMRDAIKQFQASNPGRLYRVTIRQVT